MALFHRDTLTAAHRHCSRHKDEVLKSEICGCFYCLTMFEEWPGGFQGGLNAAKYGSLTCISKATATRDLQELLSKGIIVPLGEGGGRSTKYQLNLERGTAARPADPPQADKLREIIRTASEAKQSNQFRQGPDNPEPPGEDEMYRRRGR